MTRQSYYKQIRRRGEYPPNHLGDSLGNTEDTVPAFDLFVLLVHLFVGGNQRRGTSDLEHFEEVLPKFRDELRFMVADDTIGETMLLKNLTHDSFGGFFTSDFLSTWQEMSHLHISIYYC